MLPDNAGRSVEYQSKGAIFVVNPPRRQPPPVGGALAGLLLTRGLSVRICDALPPGEALRPPYGWMRLAAADAVL